ncbi:muscle M-line assembly protein unc-89-like isoform X2 [Harmonia axyridis]|nr:muscle M-line assembly protein unc-89-like isoform X2 [Harmonia axyridis]
MAVENKTDYTEEDDDLEALRLAALNSIKKKNESKSKKEFNVLPHNNYKGTFRGGKRRFFSGQNRGGNRNGQYNNQVRNPNLIAIPTSTESSENTELRVSKFAIKNEDPPKLILPQDRYANSTTQVIEADGPSSKFDRYNNSNSESEEEDEISESKLERCDSLEALMEELDAEILGEPIKERKTKAKKGSLGTDEKINKMKVDEIVKAEEECENGDKDTGKPSSEEVIVHNKSPIKDISELPDTTEEKPESTMKEVKVENQRKFINSGKTHLQKSPSQRKSLNRRMNNSRVFKAHQPTNNPIMPPNHLIMNPVQAPQFTTVYNTVPSYTIPEVFPMNLPPPYIPPPQMQQHIMPLDIPPVGYNVPQLQPLVIEPPTSSVTMGPLSPRSAAFVLQNRAIVEKRKRSPRRSFSRSPSPAHHRPRYSKSPVSGRPHSPVRRSMSPVRRPFSPLQRSSSPRRSPVRRSLSPYRRNRDKSPRRDSPRRSPRRVRNSPKRSPKHTRESPKRNKESRRTPIKDRLGNRSKVEEKEIQNKEQNLLSSPKKQDSKPLDPVLEARKRKFESKGIVMKERVIRLKPKEDTVQKVPEEKTPKPKVEEKSKQKTAETSKPKVAEKTEDAKPKQTVEKAQEKPQAKSSVREENSTRIVLLPKNETKILAQGTTPVAPQNQLEDAMNELEMLLKDDEALELTAKVDDLFSDEETDQENEAKRSKNETANRIVINGFSKKSEKKCDTKAKWKFEESRKEVNKTKKVKKEPLTNPIENRKIEIKIRNPSKYEKNSSKIGQSSSGRKVELTKKESFSGEDSEPEIVMEEEEEDIEVTASKEGDLRAQLSRKRAERQNKLPSVEGIQSRLLQNALEGAVFKKRKSKKKEKESKECCMIKKLIKKHRCITGHCDLAVQSKKKIKLFRRFEICRRFLTDVKLPIHLRLGIAHDSDVFAESIVSEKIPRKKSKKRKHTEMEQV